MTTTQAAKNRKMPHLKVHSIDRNTWAMRNVKNRLVHTVILCPADLVSSGKISLGMSHPSGPHDHANDDTYTQINTTAMIPRVDDIVFPFIPVARMMAIAVWTQCTILHQHTNLLSTKDHEAR